MVAGLRATWCQWPRPPRAGSDPGLLGHRAGAWASVHLSQSYAATMSAPLDTKRAPCAATTTTSTANTSSQSSRRRLRDRRVAVRRAQAARGDLLALLHVPVRGQAAPAAAVAPASAVPLRREVQTLPQGAGHAAEQEVLLLSGPPLAGETVSCERQTPVLGELLEGLPGKAKALTAAPPESEVEVLGQHCSYGTIGHPEHCSKACNFYSSRSECVDRWTCKHCHFCEFRKETHERVEAAETVDWRLQAADRVLARLPTVLTEHALIGELSASIAQLSAEITEAKEDIFIELTKLAAREQGAAAEAKQGDTGTAVIAQLTEEITDRTKQETNTAAATVKNTQEAPKADAQPLGELKEFYDKTALKIWRVLGAASALYAPVIGYKTAIGLGLSLANIVWCSVLGLLAVAMTTTMVATSASTATSFTTPFPRMPHTTRCTSSFPRTSFGDAARQIWRVLGAALVLFSAVLGYQALPRSYQITMMCSEVMAFTIGAPFVVARFWPRATGAGTPVRQTGSS